MTTAHRAITGVDLHAAAVLGLDPGAIGGGYFWLDGGNVLYVRGSGNGGWIRVQTHYVQGADPGAVGSGRLWFDTDDNTLRVRNAANDGWVLAGATDHGALTGLTDDDHAQYQLRSEKQAASGYPGLNAAGFVIGNGLAFPATQVPSADVNTLDDYEEGTWTPAVSFGGSSPGVTYHANTAGIYTKVGNLVSIQGRLQLTNKGSGTGAASIAGLPFTPALQSSVAFGYHAFMSGLTGVILGLTAGSGVVLRQTTATTATALDNTHFTNGSDLIFSAVFAV